MKKNIEKMNNNTKIILYIILLIIVVICIICLCVYFLRNSTFLNKVKNSLPIVRDSSRLKHGI
jgi:amino acid transporter